MLSKEEINSLELIINERNKYLIKDENLNADFILSKIYESYDLIRALEKFHEYFDREDDHEPSNY